MSHPFRLFAAPPPDGPPPRRQQFRAALEPLLQSGCVRFGKLSDYPGADAIGKALVIQITDAEAWETVKRLGEQCGYEMWE